MLIDLQNDYKLSDLQAIVVYNRNQDSGGSSAQRIEGFKPQLLDSNMNIVYDGRSFIGGNAYHRVNGPAWSSVSSSLLTDNENDFATKIINRNNDSDLWNNTTIYYFYEFPEVTLTSANDNGYRVTVSSTHSSGADYERLTNLMLSSDDYWMADPYSTGTYDGGDGNYNGYILVGVPGEWFAANPFPKV